MSTPVVCRGLTFEWPDGTPVFSGVDVAFDEGRTGLLGLNGSGKSTLLRLIAGQLTPGRIRARRDAGPHGRHAVRG